MIKIKNGTIKQTKDGLYFNEFGYQVWVPKTKRNMEARARVLRQGLKEGRWKGKMKARAEEHLARTEAYIATNFAA